MNLNEAKKILEKEGFIIQEDNKSTNIHIKINKKNKKNKMTFKEALERVKITHKKCLENLKDK